MGNNATDRAEYVKDTIAAVATPPGHGGIGIVRVSGLHTRSIAKALLGVLPAPRVAVFGTFRDASGDAIDSGLALYFAAPRSFTGEDVLELHGHGGPVVMDLVLRRVLELGARLAAPGEFSQRAFLNDKMDLAQAEGVADLIEAATEEAARAAQRTLEGQFSTTVRSLVDNLVELRAYVEAAIDFPEEEIDFLSDGHVAERLVAIQRELDATRAAARQGQLLREGLTVAIAGRPNVGKSSLLNRLVGRDAAIVTEVPGTTRDLIREHIQIDGIPLHVIDTAGLRSTTDAIEKQGIERAWRALTTADVVMLVLDDRLGAGPEEDAIQAKLPSAPARLIVRNKIDLSGAPPSKTGAAPEEALRVSALTGDGIGALRARIEAIVGYQNTAEGTFSARARHLEALNDAAQSLAAARAQLDEHRAGELLAEDLRYAQRALGEITGEFTSDDLLGRIFSSFCIGK